MGPQTCAPKYTGPNTLAETQPMFTLPSKIGTAESGRKDCCVN